MEKAVNEIQKERRKEIEDKANKLIKNYTYMRAI